MTKQGVLTAVAAFFSLSIVFGCWLLTNTLLDQQHLSLMNTVHSTDVNDPSETEPDAEPIQVPLSTQEIANILKVWHSGQKQRYHDPFDGQLTMEEALKAADSGLSYFCENGVLPEEVLASDFIRTNAFLYDMQTARVVLAEADLNPAYSFWSVNLGNREVLIELTLNAHTGEIWMAEISLLHLDANFDDTKTLDVLDMYEAYLGLPGGGGLRSDQEYASKSYEGDQIGIIAQKKAGESGHYELLRFSLTLIP